MDDEAIEVASLVEEVFALSLSKVRRRPFAR
jgi:hypothetical protein